MKINVKVITRAHKNIVKQCEHNNYKIYTTAVPVNEKANKSIQKLLSNYFNVSKSSIKIIKGQKSKNKIIEII